MRCNFLTESKNGVMWGTDAIKEIAKTNLLSWKTHYWWNKEIYSHTEKYKKSRRDKWISSTIFMLQYRDEN